MQINCWIVWIYIRCFLHNIWICSAKRVNKGLFSKPCCCCCCRSYLFLVAGRTKKMPGLMLYLHLPSLKVNKTCFTAKTHLHQAVYILCELWSKDIFSEHYDWNRLNSDWGSFDFNQAKHAKDGSKKRKNCSTAMKCHRNKIVGRKHWKSLLK